MQEAANHFQKEENVDHFDMEILIGYILLAGVLISATLLAIGLIWHWVRWGNLRFEYSIVGMNFFEFLLTILRQMASDVMRPRFFLNMGIGVLMLTPFVRVLASVFYFVLVERNWKYSLFTGFVLSILTYSLFLR